MPTSGRQEPGRLKRGKAFHREVQDEWKAEAEGRVEREKRITKPDGRNGRIDVHVDGESDVAVVEIKMSDWDRMTLDAVRRNVRRQARQIWQYVESQLADGKDVSPGVVFPHLPRDPERLDLIERLFGEEGIQVVWRDETIEESRERHRRTSPK